MSECWQLHIKEKTTNHAPVGIKIDRSSINQSINQSLVFMDDIVPLFLSQIFVFASCSRHSGIVECMCVLCVCTRARLWMDTTPTSSVMRDDLTQLSLL